MDKHEIAQRIRGNLTQPGRLLALADELSPQYKVDDWVLWNGCIASVTRTPQPDDDVVDIRPIGGPVYHATRENIEPLGFDPEEILDMYRAGELVEHASGPRAKSRMRNPNSILITPKLESGDNG